MKLSTSGSKWMLRAAALGLLPALVGCATWASMSPDQQEVDHQKIDTVNKWARSNGVTVIWISEPMRRKTALPQ